MKRKCVKIGTLLLLIQLIAVFSIGFVYFRSCPRKLKKVSEKPYSYPQTVSIDLQLFDKIAGNYQALTEEDKENKNWHLYIGAHQGEERYFTIYDNGGVVGGEEYPWIIGTVENVDKSRITVQIDEGLFMSIESDWETEGGKLILEYRFKDNSLILTNRGSSIVFGVQKFEIN